MRHIVAPTTRRIFLCTTPHLAKMAKVVMDICQDCEKECRKFEKKHEACKVSADSCAVCFNECKKIAV